MGDDGDCVRISSGVLTGNDPRDGLSTFVIQQIDAGNEHGMGRRRGQERRVGGENGGRERTGREMRRGGHVHVPDRTHEQGIASIEGGRTR